MEAPSERDAEPTTRRPPPLPEEGIDLPTQRLSAQAQGDAAPTVNPQPKGAEALVGRRLGKYELVEELGRGGMGVVYRGHHPGLKTDVAIKVLLGGEDASGEAIERFRREAQAAARLNHDGIVRVYDIDEEAGKTYIVMEYVQGVNLQKVLEDPARDGCTSAGAPPRSGLDPATAVSMAAEISDALQAAHDAGILHRDLKPANVLRSASGRLKVMDFGLAKLVDSGEGAGTTRTGTLLGTPAYMSPEQASGDVRRMDARSDVYQVGAILYELLTGVPPYQGPYAMEVVLKVLTTDPLPPRRRDASIPPAAETICLKAMSRGPDRRYQSARAFGDDCRRHLAGEPILARPEGTLSKAVRWLRRRPRLTAALATLLVVVISAGIWAAWSRGKSSREAVEVLKDADALLAKGSPADALAKYERAVELAGEDARASDGRRRCQALLEGVRLGRRAEEEWNAGRPGEAQKTASAALSLDPGEPKALLVLALSGSSGARSASGEDARRQWTEVRALVERALPRDPQGPPLLRLDLDASEALGEVRHAIEVAERLARGSSGDLDLKEARVRLLIADGRYSDAEPAALELAQASPESPSVLKLVSRCLLAVEKPLDSLPWIDRLVERSPRDLEAYLLRSLACERLGRVPEAMADLQRVLDRDPLHAEALKRLTRLRASDASRGQGATADEMYARGCERERAGELQAAEECYSRALERDAKHVMSWLARAGCRRTRGDLAAALSDADQAASLAPDSALAWNRRGDILRLAGRTSDAIVSFTRAVEADAHFMEGYYNRGCARMKADDLGGALQDLSKAIELDPRFALAYANRGRCRLRSADLDGALADFTAAIEIEPAEPRNHYNRAFALLSMGKADAAVTDARRAIELDPKMPGAHTLLAEALIASGHAPEARPVLDAALAEAPDDVGALLARARLRVQEGNREGAREDLERLLRASPSDRQAREARELLRTVPK